MKKQYVGMGVLVLVVIAAGWYFVGSKEPKAAPVVTPAPGTPATTTDVATTTEIATSTNTTPTTLNEIELDLTKLQGKDRLYTEEEGKYENLSEEERRLVESVRCPGKSFTFDYAGRRKDVTRPCSEVSRNVEDFFRLVSLKNNTAVVVEPRDGMNSGWLHIYDLESDSRVEIIMGHDYAFGPDYIVRGRPSHLFNDRQLQDPNLHALDFYRPGMTAFAPIPNSTLPEGLWYFGIVGIEYTDFTKKFPIKFNGDSVTMEVSSFDCEESETGYPKNCEKIFIETKVFTVPPSPQT
jgi:hypothetical protein